MKKDIFESSHEFYEDSAFQKIKNRSKVYSMTIHKPLRFIL